MNISKFFEFRRSVGVKVVSLRVSKLDRTALILMSNGHSLFKISVTFDEYCATSVMCIMFPALILMSLQSLRQFKRS